MKPWSRRALLRLCLLGLTLACSTWAEPPRKIPLIAPLSSQGLIDAIPYFRLENDLQRRKVNGRVLGLDQRLQRSTFDIHEWLRVQRSSQTESLDLDTAEIFDAPWQMDPVSMNLPTALRDTIHEIRKWLGMTNVEGSATRTQLVAALIERVPDLVLIGFDRDRSVGKNSAIRNAIQHGYLLAHLVFDPQELPLSQDTVDLCQAASPLHPPQVMAQVPDFGTSMIAQWFIRAWPHAVLRNGQVLLVDMQAASRGRSLVDTICLVQHPWASDTTIAWLVPPPADDEGKGGWVGTASEAKLTWNPDLQNQPVSHRAIPFERLQAGSFCNPSLGLCWPRAQESGTTDRTRGRLATASADSRAPASSWSLMETTSCDDPSQTSPGAVFLECTLNLEWPTVAYHGGGVLTMGAENRPVVLPRMRAQDVLPLVQRVQIGQTGLWAFFRTLASMSTISTGKVVAICITIFFWMRRVRVASNSTTIEDAAKQTLQERPHDWDYAVARSVVDPKTAYHHARAGYGYYTLDVLLFIMMVAAFIACAADGALAGVSVDGSAALKQALPFATPQIQRYHIFFYVLLSVTLVADIYCKMKATILAVRSRGERGSNGCAYFGPYFAMYGRWFLNTTMFGALYQIVQVCRGRKLGLPEVQENGIVPLWEALVMHFAGHVYAAAAIIFFMDWNTSDVFHTVLLFIVWAVLALIASQHAIRLAFALICIGVQHARARGIRHSLLSKGAWWAVFFVFLAITTFATTLCVLGQLDLLNVAIDLASASTEEADMWKFTCTGLWLCALASISKITQAIVELYIAEAARRKPGLEGQKAESKR